MTPRPSQRETIMLAALACFAHNGYDATRIRDIAQEAGVSDGALYRHFSSKEALAQQLHVQAISDFTAELAACADAETSTESLQRMAFRVLALYREQPNAFVFALVQAPSEAVTSFPEGADLPIDVLARVIARGQLRGEICAGNARVLAASYLGCLMQPIALSLSAPGCVHDVLADDTADETIVRSALGSLGVAL